MAGGGMGGIWITFALLALASAGPLHRYPRESEDYQNDLSVYANYTANEVCFSEGEVFQKGDMMPNPGPCEECRCEPPSIVCNMIKCPTNNNGCRTIQRANHCCPDYNCECDYNGQLYNDGERLDLPEEPCQVCYCKGGEVMCNSITCYHRDDCDPIQVPGQCCPKYENCPVRDMGSSSLDDKNDLVRSTNKTNHVPPKREMNPWLLTKIPAVSSSAPPKPSQEPTTEGGNIIIVSDWLTERRTTTEDVGSDEERHDDLEFDSTAEPDLFTDSDHSTTVLKQDLSSDGSMVIKNSDVITPVDEVIFTRIDGPKENKEVNLGEPIQISSKETQHKLTTDISSSVTNSSSKENTTDMNITKTPLNKTVNESDLKENLRLNLPEKQSLSEVGPMETSDTKKADNFSDKREEINKDAKYNVSTESPIYPNGLNNTLEPDTMNTDSETTPSSVDLFKEANTRNVQKDVSLKHLFGLNGLTIGEAEPETTTKILLGSYTTEKEEAFTDINEFTGNSLEDQTIGESKVGELKITINIDKSTSDGFSETTTNGLFDNDVTTPFFTEVNVRKEDLVSSKSKEENASKEMPEIYTTELPKIKETEPSKGKIAIPHPTDQKIESMNENGFASGTENTNGINKSTSSIENKIKRNNFNSSVQQANTAHCVEGSTLLPSKKGSLIGDISQPTTITSEVNPDLQNKKTSATVIAQSSVDPPVTNVDTDDALPDIIIKGDNSEDGKELVSDEPPVLELNSHVPFLQLGGHGNLDPGMSMVGENHQTTNEKEKIVNEKDAETIETFSVSDSTPSLDNDRFPIKQINATDTMLSSEKISRIDQTNQEVNQEIKKGDKVKNQYETETTTAMVFTTSHIPLTPGDLKVLAEYLINDTIKTVPEKDVADYIPNQWLKGNLTSEEKIASILSAANISIAVMNKTDNKVKTFITEPTRGVSDKFEKDKLFSGLNALSNVRTYNKTGFIQGKSDEYSDSPKINSEPETPLNDEAKLPLKTLKTDSPISHDSKLIPDQNTTIKNNEMSSTKIQDNTTDLPNIKHTQPQTSTPQTVQIQGISQNLDENSLRFDEVNPADTAKRNQLAQNNLLRNDKVPDDTTSFSSTFTVTTNNPQKQTSP